MNKKIFIYLFITNSLMFFFQSISKAVYTPLVTPFQEHFNVGATEAGLLITLVFLGYALARFPSGILTDILGCEKTIIFGVSLTGITLIMVGFAPNYFILAVLTFIMGIATGLYITAGYTYAVTIGTDERETTFTALLELFGGGAGLITPYLVVLFLEDWQIGWRGLFYATGIGIILANLVFIWLRNIKNKANTESENTSEKEKGNREFKLEVFKQETLKTLKVFKNPKMRRFIIWATLVGGFGNFANLGFRSFIPDYLYEIRGYEFSTANQLFMIIFISGLFTKIAVGWVADKVGNKKILLGILITNFILFFIFTSNISHLLTIIILILFGVTFINHNTLINSYVLKLTPEKYRGTGFGLFCTLYTVIYSMGPVVTGFINDHLGRVVGMRAAVLGLIIAGILIWKFESFVG